MTDAYNWCYHFIAIAHAKQIMAMIMMLMLAICFMIIPAWIHLERLMILKRNNDQTSESTQMLVFSLIFSDWMRFAVLLLGTTYSIFMLCCISDLF